MIKINKAGATRREVIRLLTCGIDMLGSNSTINMKVSQSNEDYEKFDVVFEGITGDDDDSTEEN